MSYEWELFPIWQDRPDDLPIFQSKEKDKLEIIVSSQISELLSKFGVIHRIEIDPRECDTDEDKAFFGLSLPPIPLRNYGQLVISQFPFYKNEYSTDEGLHSVSSQDQEGNFDFDGSFWDPKISCDKRAYDRQGDAICMNSLQELYDALIVIHADFCSRIEPNTTQYDPTDFPIAIVEPELEARIAELDY